MSVNKREKDKVCIVGFAPSYKDAPWGNPEYEFWCLNEFYKVMPGIPNCSADRWFEIHDLTTPSKNTKEHQSFLQTVTVPLYVQKKYDHLPNAIVFPFEEMFKYFEDKGVLGARYFTSSIAYFVAFAIYLGFKEIEIWGVDMATSSEYQGQRNCVEFWIGLATGLGIKVYIPPSSDLLKSTQLYALESSNKNRVWIKTQVQELKKRTQQFAQQEAQAQQADLQAKIAQAELRGAMSAYNEILVRTQ